MKRLMVMMTAAVVGACAWAGSFSTSVLSDISTMTNGQSVVGYDKAGKPVTETGSDVHWWMTNWTASAEQPAVVSNDTGKAGESYLAIETETGVPLLRTFLSVSNETTKGVYTVEPVDIADHGIFVDTTVKFTGTDTAPTVASDSKLLVWLKVVEADEAEGIEGSTNLMVTCGVKVGDDYVATNYVLKAEINPADYYRLTIRADKDTTDNVATFKIYLDETQLETVDGLKVFPSILAGADKLTLSYAGFEGTGFIKSVDLFTQSDGPSFAKDKTYLTISWNEGVTGFKLGTQDFNVAGLDYTSTNLVVAGGATEVTAVINTPTYKLDKFNSAGVSELTTSENTASFNVPAFAAEGVCTLQIVAVLDRAEASFTVNGTRVTDQGTLLSGILTYVNGLGENDAVVITLGDASKLGEISLATLNNLLDFTGSLEIDLHGCTIKGTSTTAADGDYLFKPSCVMTIKDSVGGGAMIAPANGGLIYDCASLTIEKAAQGDEITFTGAIVNDCYYISKTSAWVSADLVINGGKFTVKPTTGVEGHLDDGITIPDTKEWNDDGTYWTLVDKGGSTNGFKVIIGESQVEYATFADAVAALTADGATIQLLKDCTTAIEYTGSFAFTLDLNGMTLTDSTADATLKNNGSGTITVKDSVGTGKIYNGSNADGYGIAVYSRLGAIVVNSGNFENNTKYEATATAGHAALTINGGTFKNLCAEAYPWKTEWSKLALNRVNSWQGVLTVMGGSFSSDPAQGDDSGVQTTFVAEGYKSTLNDTTGLYDVTEDVAAVAKIGDVGYATFDAALAAVENGQTITLISDIAAAVTNSNTASFTLDLNGKTVSSDAATATIKQDAIGSTLTIVDSVGTGKVVNSVDAMDMGQAIWARQGNIVVNAGYFENASTYEATVYVGAKTAKDCGSTITINGGTFVNKEAYRWGTADTFGTLNVWNSFTDTSAIKVYGGSFSTDPAKGDDSLGGTFVASGYKSTLDSTTSLYVVTEDVAAVAKIGDVGYATFADAIAAVKDGDVITLVDNSTNVIETANTSIPVANKGAFTLDLNGKLLAFNHGDAYYSMQLNGNTSMTIVDNSQEKNGQMIKLGNATHICIGTGCSVTVNGGTIAIDGAFNENDSWGACFKNEGTLTINGGTLNANLTKVRGDWVVSPREGSTTYINGGTFIGPIQNLKPGTVVITSECAAKFSETASYAGYIPQGYIFRKGEDGYYMVAEPVPATGVTLNKETVEIASGATETLTATLAPEDADVKTTVWASDDESVATVADGVVTAVEVGTTYITVTITDYSGNTKTATCTVTVKEASVPVVPEEQGTIDVDPNTGHATVTPANDTVTEIEVTGGENLTQVDIPTSVEKITGVDANKVHITYTTGAEGAPTYDITTAFTKYGDATAGVTYELNPEGSVEIDEETIPVTPTATEAESTEGTIADGAVATKSIPGLTYTLKRGTTLGTYDTTADNQLATGTTVSLKDETTDKPADKAFYVIEVTK